MNADDSPFTPGQPVPVEFFVGRADEIRSLQGVITRSCSRRRVELVFVSGPRGIGKTSLVQFVRTLVRRSPKPVVEAHCFLPGTRTINEMVARILDALVKVGREAPWYSKLAKFFGKRIENVGLFGVSVGFRAADEELEAVARTFGPSMLKLYETVQDKASGVLLVLDDLNGLAREPELANWLKALVDSSAVEELGLPLAVFLVGQEEVRNNLIKNQPSLNRPLRVVDIKEWSAEEASEFFKTTLERVGMSAKPAALAAMARYSGGLPMLAHEIGDAVFRCSTENRIDHATAVSGVVKAAEIVGRRYVDAQVLEAIRSDRYRKILGVLTTRHGQRFTRKQLAAALGDTERRAIDNFLRRMKQLGVIRAEKQGVQGSYEFCNMLHYLYLYMETASLPPLSDS